MMETIPDPHKEGSLSAETGTTRALTNLEGVDMPSKETTPLFEPVTPDSAEPLDREAHMSANDVSGDEFGDFVDAPASSTLPPPPILDPLTAEPVQLDLHSSPLAPDPLLSTRDPDPLSPNASVSKSPLQLLEAVSTPLTSPSFAIKEPRNNLVEDILKHEHGGLTLFSDPVFREKQSEESTSPPLKSPNPFASSSSRTATPTPSVTTPIVVDFNVIPPSATIPPDPSSYPSTLQIHTSSTTLSHPLASTSPSPSQLSPSLRPRTPPQITTPQATKAAKSLEDEAAIIAKHLGLIDHDYFYGREPAEASEIPIPETSNKRERSRSKLGGALQRSGSHGHGSLSNQHHETAVGGIPGSPTQRRTSLPVQAAPPVTSSGEEWDGVWGRDGSVGRRNGGRKGELPNPAPLDLDATSTVNASPALHTSFSHPKRVPSSGTLTGLWGLWRGNTASPDEVIVDDPSNGHAPAVSAFSEGHHDHITGLTTSPQPIQPTIVEGRPLDTSTAEFEQHHHQHATTIPAVAGVHGHTGRPLPRARPSLESIQQKWKVDHSPVSSHSPAFSSPLPSHTHSPARLHPTSYTTGGHSSRSPSRSPSRTRVTIEPVTITHSSPFAPPPPPPNSSLFMGSGSLSTGFGSATSQYGGPSSFGSAAGGKSRSANPFGSHSFTQISGAPGFKPDEYDWDKGFSEELERELQGVQNEQVKTPKTAGVRQSSRDWEQSGEPGGERGRQAKRESLKRDVLKKEAADHYGHPNGSPTTPSLYQTIGSKFGFGSWGAPSSSSSSGSSSPATTSRAPARTAPGSSSSSSTYPDHHTRVGQLGRSGHGRSATTPTSATGYGEEAIGDLIEKRVGGLDLKARKESTVGVLTQHIADLIRPHLPPLSRLPRSWSLLYSLDQHGISLNTLYTNCEAPEKQRKTGHQPYVGMRGAVVVLRDAEADVEQYPAGKSVFGAFIADGLGRKVKGFYGGGDSFLWKYDAASDEVKVFKSTGKNSYFAICDTDYIGFGGGSTSYGLWVDSSLTEGSSAPCPTFGNEVLCSNPGIPGTSTPSSISSTSNGSFSTGSKFSLLSHSGSELGKEVEFECVGLEVWGIGPG